MQRKSFCKNNLFLTICVICGVFICVICGSGCGRSFHFSRMKSTASVEKNLPAVISARHELRVGEKLTYEIRWMGVPVGIACFNVKEISPIDGRDCYHVVVTVRSNVFLSKIYRVDDEFHTYIDKENLHTLRFIKRQAEGRYRSHELVDYDQKLHKAVYKSLLNNSTKEFSIAENSQDDLSAIYCFRMQDAEFGKPISMNVNADEKNWILEIRILQRGYVRLYNMGKLDAIEVEPAATRVDGKKLTKGRAWIWFSADENRIPLAAKAKASLVGTVTAVLTNIE